MNEDEIDTLIAKLEISKQQLAKVTLQLAKMYCKKSGKTIDQILDLMKQQTWLTAEEAKTWGFVDEVFTPEVTVNYLENLQMVAMITGNDFPPPSHKNSSAPTPQILNTDPGTEDSLFEKLWNRLSLKAISTPKNKVEMKKQFLNINNVLNLENMESTDEGVFLNEEQLESIENRILEIQQSYAERDSAISERDTAIAERDTAQNNLREALCPFDAIHATSATAQSADEKVLAIRVLLSKILATPAVGIQGGYDKIVDEADWDTINNLEHNKHVDQNS